MCKIEMYISCIYWFKFCPKFQHTTFLSECFLKLHKKYPFCIWFLKVFCFEKNITFWIYLKPVCKSFDCGWHHMVLMFAYCIPRGNIYTWQFTDGKPLPVDFWMVNLPAVNAWRYILWAQASSMIPTFRCNDHSNETQEWCW